MKKYRLEKIVDGKWSMHGLYPEKYIPQLAQAISDLNEKGYKMYETMRIVEVDNNGETRIL